MSTNVTNTYDLNGEYHSYDDKPAHVFFDYKEWYYHGKLHRSDDKPAVVSERGHKEWWVYGKRHRHLGPAIIRTNGVMSWYEEGRHLRTL